MSSAARRILLPFWLLSPSRRLEKEIEAKIHAPAFFCTPTPYRPALAGNMSIQPVFCVGAMRVA